MELKLVSADDVPKAANLEKLGYSKAEAASLEQLVYRYESAPELFLGCYQNGDLIGFICSTRFPGQRFPEDSMKMHDPAGENICIHSVCVHPSKRRQGIATKMLEHYIENVRSPGANRFILLSRPNLVQLYADVGFSDLGQSQVVHGSDPWIEMELVIDSYNDNNIQM